MNGHVVPEIAPWTLITTFTPFLDSWLVTVIVLKWIPYHPHIGYIYLDVVDLFMVNDGKAVR